MVLPAEIEGLRDGGIEIYGLWLLEFGRWILDLGFLDTGFLKNTFLWVIKE